VSKKIVIRTDASVQIGSGHIMRCLTLAGTLRSRGCGVSFICRELPGHLCDFVESKGYKVHRLPYDGTNSLKNQNNIRHEDWLGVDWGTDAEQTLNILQTSQTPDWLIVDHYALDRRWETMMRPLTRKIMVIDDIADRPHDCDLLLDQNLYDDMESRYDGRVPDKCTKLLGPHYALLRPEFIEARKKLRVRDSSVKRIFVFFGGADLTNETEKALKAVQLLERSDIVIDVVVGSANPNKDAIRQYCASLPNANYFSQVDNMAFMMTTADLAIGGGGGTTWERCSLSLPSLVISVADNQVHIAEAAAAAGAIIYLGSSDKVTTVDVLNALRTVILAPDILRKLTKHASGLVDGMGADRVLSSMGAIK
jgi:UDP-2,4-diacetamido-2,4,6-trideoxy-beta-L-altropyranose hydrolase